MKVLYAHFKILGNKNKSESKGKKKSFTIPLPKANSSVSYLSILAYFRSFIQQEKFQIHL